MSKGRDGAGGGGAAAVLLRYLREQNRPYSAQDAFGNLQREHGLGKAAVVKALEQLAQQGRVREKTYGKQKIYFADQEQLPAASDAELRSLDGQISALSSKVQELQQSCRQLEAQLKELNSSMTSPEMAKEVEALRKDCASYTEKLEKIKCATNHVTPEEKEQVELLGLGPGHRPLPGGSQCCVWGRSAGSSSCTAGSGGGGSEWQPSCWMPSWRGTPRARSSSLTRSGSRLTRTRASRCRRPCEGEGRGADAGVLLLGWLFWVFFWPLFAGLGLVLHIYTLVLMCFGEGG
ncbi:homologous-pairing protein 2 homolog isoform X1 [Apus apus]|uniref:homologous-pairing protein 2 homolog isoform X1 n=1 Tax=Apus apus TaxID=8895 RepID=UPI0021F8C2A6|nr:homologous-pairing protein 2 homolog isoform X1 [Apus apus]